MPTNRSSKRHPQGPPAGTAANLLLDGRPGASESAQSYADRAHDFLLTEIMEGRLLPGDEVNRRQVAERLGVSLAPVSEAVSQLESEGFLEVAPRRQTRVRIIRKEEVRGLLIIREAMECQAARLYAGKRVEENEEALLALATEVDNSKPGTAANEHAECRFHEALVGLVDCPFLSEEFSKIMRRKLFNKLNAVMPWTSQPPLDCHCDLVRNLKQATSDEAEVLIRRHLERGREVIMK